jgi:hypothetical protein
MEKRVFQQTVLATVVLMLSSSVATAATFYVRVDGSNNNTGRTNDSGGAWRTIDYAAAHVIAGDTVRVQAGTYVEVASPSVSGTSGNTVTLVADGIVTTCGMSFSGRSYIRVIGFTMDAATSGCSNSTIVTVSGINIGLEFWNNTLLNSNHGFFVNASDRCNSCIIVGGAVHHVNNGYNGITMTGNDSFVGYVDFDSICYLGVSPSGNRLRFVNLNFSNMIQCGATHPDFIYPQGSNTLGYSNSLVESSYGVGTVTSTDNKAMHVQNQTTVAWNDNIWRLNLTYNLGSGFYSVYDTSGAINRLRFYNNTHVNCDRANNAPQYDSCGNLSAQGGHGVSASIYNNVFYQAWADAAIPYVAVWSESFGPVVAKDYNLAYSPNGVGSFYGAWTAQVHRKDNVNPGFVNVASDFTLQAGSAARGAGGPLTTANGSGNSSSSLTVATGTGSFFIGSNANNLPQYGGALVPGDLITVGSTTARVATVTGDTLTLASAISWTKGAPVYFGSSSTIDLGAYPYKSAGYALSAGYAIANGTVTVTPNDASLVRFVVCYSDRVPYAIDNTSPYTCAAPTGAFTARVYPRYASKTLWVTVGVGAPSAPTNIRVTTN